MQTLTVHDGLPPGLLDRPAPALAGQLDGPTLLRLPGTAADAAPLFVSVLLHGNEPGGWEAMRRLLAGRKAPLARPLWLFIGNVAAAAAGLRHLDGQPDFNRVWRPSAGVPPTPMVAGLMEQLRRCPPWLAVDVHNNTGANPHYSCITHTDPELLDIALRFSRTVVLVHQPDSILVRALQDTCPALVLESGQAGELRGVEHVQHFVAGLLDGPPAAAASGSLDLFCTRVSVKVQPGLNFAFARPSAPADGTALELLPEFERFNFDDLEPQTLFARVHGPVPSDAAALLRVTDDAGQDVTNRWFHLDKQELRLSRAVVPSMFTRDIRVIRQDVLCYLMERIQP